MLQKATVTLHTELIGAKLFAIILPYQLVSQIVRQKQHTQQRYAGSSCQFLRFSESVYLHYLQRSIQRLTPYSTRISTFFSYWHHIRMQEMVVLSATQRQRISAPVLTQAALKSRQPFNQTMGLPAYALSQADYGRQYPDNSFNNPSMSGFPDMQASRHCQYSAALKQCR